MRIGQQIALRFTLVSALLTGAILLFIYSLTQGIVHSDFKERLAQQAGLEVLHYATPNVRDVLPEESFLLVNPQTSVYSEAGVLLFQKGSYEIQKNWIDELRSSGSLQKEITTYTTIGKKHTVEGRTYLVFVSDKDLPGQHELDILQKTIAIGWVTSLLLSYLAGLYFSSNALRPVKRVVREVNQVNKDNLGYRLSIQSGLQRPDEMDELMLTFNALLERIQSAFEAQKRFLQHASHELKTPLTAIMAEAELALTRDRSVDEYRRTLDVVVSESERLIGITHGLLMLARLEEGYIASHVEPVNTKELIAASIDSLTSAYADRKVNIEGDTDIFALGNRQLLQIALTNVIDNALKYSDDDVVIRMKKFDDNIHIEVTDNGIGIPESDIDRVRSALFRASNVGSHPGAGLGLSLVQRIVDVHKGNLDIQSPQGQGTTCSIRLPAA